MLYRRLAGAALAAALISFPADTRAETVLKSDRFPAWVHFEDASKTEYAKSVLAALEDAWRFQVEGLGFTPPPADDGVGGSDDYDVFIEKNDNGAACQQGAPVPGQPGRYRSRLSIAPTLPLAALPLVLSHEFHHAIQFGICGDAGDHAAESGAVYISGVHRRGEANQLTYSLGFNTFQEHPGRSLDWAAELGNPYPYGSALFLMFLDQRYGQSDGRIVKRVWDAMDEGRTGAGCPHYFDGFRATVDFEKAFREFVRARWFVGPHDDGRHIQNLKEWEGGALPQKTLLSVTLASDHAALPVEGAEPKGKPMPYGASFVRFSLAGLAPEDRVQLAFAGAPSVRWGIETIALADGVPSEEASIDVDADGTKTTDIAVGPHTSLVVAFVNLGDGHYVGDGPGWKSKNLRYSLVRVEPAPPAPPEAPAAAPPRREDGGCAVRARRPTGDARGVLGVLLAAAAIAVSRRVAARRSCSGA